MKFNVLLRDWQAIHPTGNIWQVKTGNRWNVSYKQDGKVYTYYSPTVYALAEKLHLISEVVYDVPRESLLALAALQSNKSYTSYAPLHDTLRHMLYEQTGKNWHVESTSCKDEYDRTYCIYTGISINTW